jgi:Fic family protein
MNLILMRNGYPIMVIKKDDIEEYMKALEKASTQGNIEDFINLVASAVDKSIDTYLYIIG